jgi:hypothetical protein
LQADSQTDSESPFDGAQRRPWAEPSG